jgi:hypothetical protein
MGQQHDNSKKGLQLQTEDPITQVSRKEAEGAQEMNFWCFLVLH